MSIRETLLRQMARPHGRMAPAMARMFNLSNGGQNQAGVAALDVRPGQAVLDAGFGGGVGLDLLLSHTAAHHVVGVDISAEMVERFRRRHGQDIRSGRLQLHEAAIEDLPIADGTVDRALTVNTYYYWRDADQGLSELARVLGREGRLVLVVSQPEVLRAAGLTPDRHRIEEPDRIAVRALASGFTAAHTQGVGDLKRSVLVIATT